MNHAELSDAIACYGSKLVDWPAAARQTVEADPKLLQLFQLLAAEEVRFETLLASRHFELPAADFSQRITASALADKPVEDKDPGLGGKVIVLQGWRQRFAGSELLRPLLGMAATLVLGLVVGYSLPQTEEMSAEENFNDYTALLYIPDNLL